jgi:DNA repair exonuclease SbcCD ATPase subunit
MAAEEAPKPGRSWSQHCLRIVNPHLERIEQLVTQLAEDEQMTGTPGWRRQYADLNKKHRDNVKVFLLRLTTAADIMKAKDVSEDALQEAKGAIKSLAEEWETHNASRRRTVDPLTQRVEALQEIRDQIAREAREAASENPLHMSGVPDEVGEYMRQFPAALWDDDQGMVVMS